MTHRQSLEGSRVLVLAPFGRDADSVVTLLARRGYQAHACLSLQDMAKALDADIGVAVLTEEALNGDTAVLIQALERQPPWSDVPFLLLAGRRAGVTSATEKARRQLPDIISNVVVLERPLGSESLVSAVAAAMKSRQRQFETRDRIDEINSHYRRLDVLLENLPIGVAFINPDRSTLIANPAYRRFRPDGRIPSQDANGEAEWEGYDDSGMRIPRSGFATERALRGDLSEPTEYIYHPAEGPDVWTRVSATPLLDDADNIVGAISVVVDIDAQKQAQLALAVAAERLEIEVAYRTAALEDALKRLQLETVERERAEASLRQSQKMEAVGQLTGGIAHDFNNMLTGVIGSIDIMRRRIADGRIDDLDRFMDAASTSAQRAAALTQRLLAFSRRQSLDTKATDINRLVTSLEDLLDRTMSEKIAVEIVTKPDLPFARTDANQLESAILNLAINARDAMPDGGRLLVETSTVELDQAYASSHPDITAGHYVVVAVSDTGVGIEPELLDKVIEPFFTTKPIGQGTGLGLSMIYGFAQQTGGQVRIHSRPGDGTSVKLFMPVAASAPADETAKLAAGPAGHGEVVLVVEDDDSVRLLVEEVLQELGYAVITASDPTSAIEVLGSSQTINMMVTDVGLPNMNGRQLAEIARQHRPEIPILFVTGYAENAAIRSNFLGTNMAMITKPFTLEDLATKVAEMVV